MTKIKFDSERQRYTVQAFDARFIVCTKPFNAQETYLYSVVDLLQATRGSFGRWGPPIEIDTPEGAAKIIVMLHGGDVGISERHSVPLSADEISRSQQVIGGAS